MLFLMKRAFRLKTEEIMPEHKELLCELREAIDKVFGGSLFVREVDTGSCNACEVEVANLNNPYYDIERFGIKFVASPKHADVLLITGCVTRNMLVPMIKAYENAPNPKFIVTLGDCTKDCSYFKDSYAVEGPVEKHIPVHLHIPGCPPEPRHIIEGFLKLCNRWGR